MANLVVKVNVSAVDDVVGGAGTNYIDFSQGNDQLIFSNGSPSVADGQPIPSASELQSAGVIIDGTEQIVPKHFLADLSTNILEEINLMGNQDTRYVICASFDAPTASEPVAEWWDDISLNTINTQILGNGTPSSSYMRGITTTGASSGVNWSPTGTRMAGSSSGFYIELNDGLGALTLATDLYFNLSLVTPASAVSGVGANPVLVIKWLSN